MTHGLHILSIHREYETWCAAPRAVQPYSARLLSMPPELLRCLFDTIDAMGLGWHTTVALAVTCKLLLQIARPHILRGMRAVHAPWAGCRLVCVGERTEDLPAGMLSDEEEQEMMREWVRNWRRSNSGSDADDSDEDEDSATTASESSNSNVAGGTEAQESTRTPRGSQDADAASVFLTFMRMNYRLVFGVWEESHRQSAGSALLDKIKAAASSVGFRDTHDHTVLGGLGTVHPRETGADVQADMKPQRVGASIELSTRGDAHRFRALYNASADLGPSVAADTATAKDRVRVLCNFVTREYVRENALTVARGRVVRVTWGHVLLSKICWSSDPYTGMMSGRALHRGAWAGGRFCITTLDSLPEIEVEMGFAAWGEGGRGWRDVSAEVNELLTDLFDEQGYVRKKGPR